MHTLLMDNRPFHISEISQNITVTTPISCIKYYIDYIKYRFTYNMDNIALYKSQPTFHGGANAGTEWQSYELYMGLSVGSMLALSELASVC